MSFTNDLVLISQIAPASSIMTETRMKLAFQLPPEWSVIQPMSGGAGTSPRAWIVKIFTANALARMAGGVILYRKIETTDYTDYTDKK